MVSTAQRDFISKIFLWLFVVALSLQMGAGLYEMRVVTPLWSGSPPASVRDWNSDARYAIEPRARFWRYCTAAVGLAAVGALVSAWLSRACRRGWLVASAVTVILLVLATYLYFAPALAELLAERGAPLSDEEIAERVSRWLWWSRVRATVYACAWLAALWAFSATARERND